MKKCERFGAIHESRLSTGMFKDKVHGRFEAWKELILRL